MSIHVFRKPNARKVYLRIMVLLETEYQDILRYVLMILASVDKIVACVQENMYALREVIAGLRLGPAEYDLHHRNQGYGPCHDSNSRKQFQCKLVYFRLDLLRHDHLDRRFGSNPSGVLSQELLKNKEEKIPKNSKQFQEGDEVNAVLHLGVFQFTGSVRNGESYAATC